MDTVLSVAALAAAATALGIALLGRRPGRGPADPVPLTDVPAELRALRAEVAALRAEGAGALRHLGVVRYDAFGDTGGRLSWSVALLDDRGDGVVLTTIQGRGESRSYAKPIDAGVSSAPLSAEEEQAVGQARIGSPG